MAIISTMILLSRTISSNTAGAAAPVPHKHCHFPPDQHWNKFTAGLSRSCAAVGVSSRLKTRFGLDENQVFSMARLCNNFGLLCKSLRN